MIDKQMIKEKLDAIIGRITEENEITISSATPEEDAEEMMRAGISQYWITHEFYTAEEIEERFAIPPQFAVFRQHYSYFGNYWRSLTSLDGIITETTYWYRYFSHEKERYRQNGNYPMMMLYIGGWSDKHWYFMSCDKAQHFGQVFEAYDTDFFDIPRIVEEEWPDFLTFLESEFR